MGWSGQDPARGFCAIFTNLNSSSKQQTRAVHCGLTYWLPYRGQMAALGTPPLDHDTTNGHQATVCWIVTDLITSDCLQPEIVPILHCPLLSKNPDAGSPPKTSIIPLPQRQLPNFLNSSSSLVFALFSTYSPSCLPKSCWARFVLLWLYEWARQKEYPLTGKAKLKNG